MGVNLFVGLIGFVMYIVIPVVVILLILWLYRVKQNSDIQVEQNKEIIQLLKNNDDKSNRDV